MFGAQSSTPTQSARHRLLTAPSPSPSTAPTLEGSRSAAAPQTSHLHYLRVKRVVRPLLVHSSFIKIMAQESLAIDQTQRHERGLLNYCSVILSVRQHKCLCKRCDSLPTSTGLGDLAKDYQTSYVDLLVKFSQVSFGELASPGFAWWLCPLQERRGDLLLSPGHARALPAEVPEQCILAPKQQLDAEVVPFWCPSSQLPRQMNHLCYMCYISPPS